MMMGADQSAVDHLKGIGNQPALAQCVHGLLPEPREGATSKLAVNAGPLPNSSGRSRQGEPVRAIQKMPSRKRRWFVGLLPFGARTAKMTIHETPFRVWNQIWCQDGLHRRRQLESRSARTLNHFFNTA
jgi:hypothetical protein